MKRLRCGIAVRRGEAGFSMIEGLMAAALLLVVAVSILPLFMRALESNSRGGRSSELTAMVNTELESINQASLDNPAWRLTGVGTSVLDLGDRYWDTGQLEGDGVHTRLGDEQWVDNRTDAAGLVMWSRNLAVRKYSFADVHQTIEVGGTVLSTLGDPRLFDSPLDTDAAGNLYSAHFTEFRVHVKEDREGVAVRLGHRMTIGHFRVF